MVSFAASANRASLSRSLTQNLMYVGNPNEAQSRTTNPLRVIPDLNAAGSMPRGARSTKWKNDSHSRTRGIPASSSSPWKILFSASSSAAAPET